METVKPAAVLQSQVSSQPARLRLPAFPRATGYRLLAIGYWLLATV